MPSTADESYPETTISTIAFGSCHRNKSVKPDKPIIWNAISKLEPDAFLWTGDAVYSPTKTGITSLDVLKHEYDELLHNATIGYSTFLSSAKSGGFLKGGVHGTWDDHDFGGNDFGKEMPHQKERRNLLFDFLGVTSKERREEREGVYSSVTFGSTPRKVKVIFLDTRSGRDQHCIPSVAAMPLPFGLGSAFACISRWITCGLKIQNMLERCKNGKVLDEEQWKWLENQLLENDAQMNIIVSSIQVLTTNPFMETWGQFPEERLRLLKLLNSKPVVLLSGDVHHGEIADSSAGYRRQRRNIDHDNHGRIIEVTSSGLTHSCLDPFYGGLCEPLLKKFPNHRYKSKSKIGQDFFTEKNFGSIRINWDALDRNGTMAINVHDRLGNVVLSTTELPLSTYSSNLRDDQFSSILSPIDGHLIPHVARLTFGLAIIVVSFILRRKFEKILKKAKME